MMYRVITTFRDLEDGHLYQIGDPFPHDGREIRKERLESLLSAQNRVSKPVIEQDEQDIGAEQKPAQKSPRKRKTKE